MSDHETAGDTDRGIECEEASALSSTEKSSNTNEGGNKERQQGAQEGFPKPRGEH